ncbi:MAG TPA: nuclear transport factor 2 family protein [Actinomycetota bacterium]|nr:nuclear transport factor 2 family protein [Actinomycetota bacterium]
MSDSGHTLHEDRREIDDLLSAYAAAIDAKDWDALRTLFADEAVLDYTGSSGPRGSFDEVLPFLQQGLGLFTMTQHLITNRQIAVDGDSARSSAYLFNPMGRDNDHGGLDLLLVGGRYETRYRRAGDRWRIAEHVATIVWGPRPA